MLWLRLLGIVLLAVGALLLRHFPDIGGYQRGEMLVAGLFVGVLLLVLGIALVIFG